MQKELHDQPTVTLEVILAKALLVGRWGITLPCDISHLFLFPARCEEILAGTMHDPSALETLLWNGKWRGKCALILADSDLLVDGPSLTVVGIRRIESWTTNQVRPVLASDRLAAIHQTCRDVVRWERPWVAHLTPHALRVTVASDEASPVVQALLAHWANVAVLFLADRVREEDTGHTAVFATEQRRTQITLLTTIDPGMPLPLEQVRALGEIAEWAYDESQYGHRIRMVQAVVAMGLAQLRQPVPMATLLLQAPMLWRDLQWHWKSFIAEEIERYT